MIGVGMVELLIVAIGFWVVLVPAAVVAIVRFSGLRRDEAARPETTVEAIRHARATSLLALCVFAASLAVAVPTVLAYGSLRLLGLMPLLAAGLSLLALALGELWSRRAEGTLRKVALNARTQREVISGGWLRAWVVCAGALVVTGLVCGRLDGRFGGRVFEDGIPWPEGAAFPGWGVFLPQLVGLLAVGLAWAGVVRLAVLRPTVEGASVADDNALRRATAARATRVALAGTMLTLGGDLVAAGTTATRYTAATGDALSVGAAVLGGLVLCGGCWALLVPSARLPRVIPVGVPTHAA